VNNDEILLKSRIDAVDPAVTKIENVRSIQTILNWNSYIITWLL
jgi:hypothetical protein